jgi:hypothetical protein
LEGKEIEEIEEAKELGREVWLGQGADEIRVRRVFTSDNSTDYRSCQYIN